MDKHKYAVNDLVRVQDWNLLPYTVVIYELLEPVLPTDTEPNYKGACTCHGDVLLVNESSIIGRWE